MPLLLVQTCRRFKVVSQWRLKPGRYTGQWKLKLLIILGKSGVVTHPRTVPRLMKFSRVSLRGGSLKGPKFV